MNDIPLEAFRSPDFARSIAREIAAMAPDAPVTIMHVCGTHEHAIARAGIRALLPAGVRLIAGPGCPVCVCPARDVDLAMEAARRDGVMLTTFGDMMRVPASDGSFERLRAEGADIRVVYSPADAVRIARENPAREVVFMAVGFETTAAPIAAALASDPPLNFSVIPSLRLIPPALRFLLGKPGGRVDAFLLPGHVSVVLGRVGYRFLEAAGGVPAAIAGFEPVDILLALHDLLGRIVRREGGEVRNLYGRVVREEGNPRAREAMEAVFAEAAVPWRGIGSIPASGLVLRPSFERLAAAVKLGLRGNASAVDVRPGCECHRVILGEVEPEDCSLFGASCTPRSPIGPCMVSSEGTCRARYEYRRVSAAGECG